MPDGEDEGPKGTPYVGIHVEEDLLRRTVIVRSKYLKNDIFFL